MSEAQSRITPISSDWRFVVHSQAEGLLLPQMLALLLVGLSFQSVSFLLLHYSVAPLHLDHQIQLLSTAHRSLTLTSNTLSYLLFHKPTYCLMLYAFHLLLSSLNTFLYLSHQGNPYSSFLCFLFFPILYLWPYIFLHFSFFSVFRFHVSSS